MIHLQSGTTYGQINAPAEKWIVVINTNVNLISKPTQFIRLSRRNL